MKFGLKKALSSVALVGALFSATGYAAEPAIDSIL